MNAALDLLFGEHGKPALDQIEPGAAGGSEVQMKERVPCQPALHFGVLMGGVVIADQVQLPVGRNGLVDETEKPKPFLMAMLQRSLSR